MRATLPLVALSVMSSACQSPLDTTRTVDSYDSFGAAIYREACQRVAYTGQLAQQQAGTLDRVDVSGGLGRAVCVAGEPPPAGAPLKLSAIVGERPDIVETVDAILPQPFLATLETFLERILPLYDDGTVERAISGIGDLLGVMADDPEVSPALARLGLRHGYRPASTAPGLVHALVEYPELDAFMTSFLGLIGPGGAGEPEWHQLLAAGAVTLATAAPEPDPAAPDRTLKLALDLLLASHPELVTGTARPAVARDARGLARVAIDETGTVVAPFVDLDHDGLADADGDGRFVGAGGRPLALATPFPEPGVADSVPRDALGRALTGPGAATTLYQYLDLDGTVLAGAAREAPALLDPGKDTALGLAWGAEALLGTRATQIRSYAAAATGSGTSTITYQGFDTTQSPALDLLHAFVQLLGVPDAQGRVDGDAIAVTLSSAATLLAQYESRTSRVIGAMLDTSDRGKLHPEAQVPATSTVFDDLIPLVARAVRVPGLAEDLIAALQDPHVKGLAPMMARLMTATNQIDFNHTADAIGSARGAPDFDLVSSLDAIEPVDRTRPDTDYNRSLLQRIAHMVHDSAGVQFCNKDGAVAFSRTFQRCRLFKIDDLSLFFALNLASDSIRMDKSRFATTYSKASFREQLIDAQVRSTISDDTFGDTNLQNRVGITGFTRFPTPKALARALFLRLDDPGTPQFLKDTTEPTACVDGDRFIDVHDRSIMSWELPVPGNPSGFADDTFYDAVRPLIDAFARHDECLAFDSTGTTCTRAQNAVKIFVDLLAALHTHWGSPQSSYFGHQYQSADRSLPRFAYPDNLVSFEPLIAEVLGADLVPAVLELAPALEALTVDGTPDGAKALPVLTRAARYVFDPDAAPAGLAYRDGRTTTVEADGVTAVPRATPFYLLADAFLAKRTTLADLSTTSDGAAQAGKWRSATSALVDQVLTVDRIGDSWQFRNRRLHAITQLLIDFARKRVQAHVAAGDLDSWVHRGLTSDLSDKLTSPVFAALADLVARLEHDEAARAQFYGLMNYLVDERNDVVFQTVLTTLADQAQQLLDDRSLVPIQRALGAALDPSKGVVDAEVSLVKRSHDLDSDRALLTILRNLFRPGANGATPASSLADILSELNRARPGQGGELDAGDEHNLLGEIRGFLTDHQRGFLRFVGIVQNRGSR